MFQNSKYSYLNTLAKEQHHRRVYQTDPDEPSYIEYKKPFTASPYYNYLDAFLLGLKLETYVDYSQECIDAACYTADDWIYL